VEVAGIDLEELEFDSIGSWPKQLRIAVIVGVCFLTFALGYSFDLSDLFSQLSELSTKLEQSKATFIDTQQKVANLDAYKKEVKIVEEELGKLTEQLPQSNEQAGLLEDISQQATSSGLQFITIKPKGQENKGFYQESPMELTLSGDYDGFGEFASNVSNMPRIVTLHDFTIKKNDTSGKGALMMVVTAKTYWASGGK